MGVEAYGNDDDIDNAVDDDDDDTDGGVDTAAEPVWTVHAGDEVGNADDDCWWSARSGDGARPPAPVTDGRCSSGSIKAMAVTGSGGGGGVSEREDDGEGDRLSGCS